MQTLRKGSKGEDVKTLQKALGITADGIFGTTTEIHVKAFQTGHRLTADGIVGEKTWKALGITPTVAPTQVSNGSAVTSPVSNGSAVTIKQKPLSVHITKRNGTPIKYLVIHFTAGSHSRQGKALACYDVFANGKASADFAVDDVDIVQLNPDPRKYYCWAVGGTKYNNKGGKLYRKAYNSNCISIEICSTCVPSTQQAVNTDNHKGWSFTTAALNNAIKLARHLMQEYNIPTERVIRHYDVTGKLCPGIPGWNDEPIKTIDGKKTSEINDSMEWKAFLLSL